jgi:hypothetical protein
MSTIIVSAHMTTQVRSDRIMTMLFSIVQRSIVPSIRNRCRHTGVFDQELDCLHVALGSSKMQWRSAQ